MKSGESGSAEKLQTIQNGSYSPVVLNGLNYYFGSGEFRTQVLFNNCLNIEPGKLVVMTGPSGSGKTTLLTLLGAIRTLQEGELQILGRDVSTLSEGEIIDLRREIGFIFQMHNLFSSLSALENVQMTCQGDAAEMEQNRSDGIALLKRLGLEKRLNYRPSELSGGQRQRVAVARALVGRPKLILADEPTAALDKVSCLEVINMLKEWANEYGSAVVVVTHDNRILDSADRIVKMVDGAIVSDVVLQEAIQICEFLRKLSIFSNLNNSELSLISEKMKKRPFVEGEVLLQQGDVGEEFFLIRDGEVDVFVDSSKTEILSTGQCFGERALLGDGKRAATIIARKNGLAYVLSKEWFLHAVSTSPNFEMQIKNLYFNK